MPCVYDKVLDVYAKAGVAPVSGPEATIEISVAWRKGETSPTVLQFLECVWRVFPQDRRVAAMVRTPSRRAS